MKKFDNKKIGNIFHWVIILLPLAGWLIRFDNIMVVNIVGGVLMFTCFFVGNPIANKFHLWKREFVACMTFAVGGLGILVHIWWILPAPNNFIVSSPMILVVTTCAGLKLMLSCDGQRQEPGAA